MDSSDYDSPESEPYHPSGTASPETFFGLASVRNTGQIYCLGTFQLLEQQVRDLLLVYARFQHKHLPILDTQRKYQQLYQETPFLFWTLLTVAIRGSKVATEMLDSIMPQYNGYLGQVMIQSPLSLSSIQCLLLICMWPFPVQHQRNDPSWNLCNIALGAMSNLEIPNPTQQNTKAGEDSEAARRRTWLACFQVTSWLGSTLAVRPPLRNVEDLANISKALALDLTSREFAAQIEIQRQVQNYTSVLVSDQALISSPSTIQMFEKELSSVAARFGEDWTLENDIALQVAKLNLHSSVIVSASKEIAKSSHPSPNSIIGTSLFKCFQAAVKLISLYSKMMEDVSNESPTGPTYMVYPKYYHFTFAKSALFLLRFALSRDSGFVESDRDIARNHIRIAHELFLQNAQKPDDECARAARMIDTLGRIEGTTSAQSIRHVVASHGELEIVRAAARHAATLQGRTTSFDAPAPEVPAYTPPASSASGMSPHGQMLAHNSGDSMTNLQSMSYDPQNFDWQYNEHWLPPYFEAPQSRQSWEALPFQTHTEMPITSGVGTDWNPGAANSTFGYSVF